MEHMIALTHKEYQDLESLGLEVERLKKELQKEKEKKNGYLFLRIAFTSWNPYDEKALKFGTLDYSVESAPIFKVDEERLKGIIIGCIANLLHNKYDNYILTKDEIKDAVENVDLQRKLLREEVEKLSRKEEEIEERLNKLPKLLKWLLKKRKEK